MLMKKIKNLGIFSYLHTIVAVVPIKDNTIRAVKILTITSESRNNSRKNVAAIVSSAFSYIMKSAGTTEMNATFTRRSVDKAIGTLTSDIVRVFILIYRTYIQLYCNNYNANNIAGEEFLFR